MTTVSRSTSLFTDSIIDSKGPLKNIDDLNVELLYIPNHRRQSSCVSPIIGESESKSSLVVDGRDSGKRLVLWISDSEFMATMFATDRILYSLKNSFVCPGRLPSLYLYLVNPGITDLKPIFCLEKIKSILLLALNPHTSEQ